MLLLGRRHRRAGRGRARLRRHRRRHVRGTRRRGLPRLARRARTRPRRCPGGESRLDALARYADGCARLLARRDARCVLLVVHDVPIRFLRNALLAADPLDGPGAHRREPRAPERGRGAARGRAGRHAAQAVLAFRRSDPGVGSATAVFAADDGHRVPVVVARDHHCRPMMTDHDAQQATHVTNMPPIATNCPYAARCKPLEGVRCPATIARCGRRSSLAVRAASGWPLRASWRAAAAGSSCWRRAARSRSRPRPRSSRRRPCAAT